MRAHASVTGCRATSWVMRPARSSAMIERTTTPAARSSRTPMRRRTSNSSSVTPIAAPRPARSSEARSNTIASQPICRSKLAANRPPTDPPMIRARAGIGECCSQLGAQRNARRQLPGFRCAPSGLPALQLKNLATASTASGFSRCTRCPAPLNTLMSACGRNLRQVSVCCTGMSLSSSPHTIKRRHLDAMQVAHEFRVGGMLPQQPRHAWSPRDNARR